MYIGTLSYHVLIKFSNLKGLEKILILQKGMVMVGMKMNHRWYGLSYQLQRDKQKMFVFIVITGIKLTPTKQKQNKKAYFILLQRNHQHNSQQDILL
jgi:hypothetical protein